MFAHSETYGLDSCDNYIAVEGKSAKEIRRRVLSRYWSTRQSRAAKELKKAGIKPRGRMAYELAAGRTVE